MGRNPCCSKEGLNRGAWTAAEDKILKDYIEVHGEGRWRNLPKKADLKRCGKSCRLRWLNYLKPDIKRGNISPDEEELIIRLHKLLGNRWSLIAGRLPGRTDNEIKNYWNTKLGKKVHDDDKLTITTASSGIHHNNSSQLNEKTKSKSIVASTAALPSLESQPKNNQPLEAAGLTPGTPIESDSPEHTLAPDFMLDADLWLSDLLSLDFAAETCGDDGHLMFPEDMLEDYWTATGYEHQSNGSFDN